MSALSQENEPLIPKDHDIALAKQSSKELAALFPKKEKDFQMVVKVEAIGLISCSGEWSKPFGVTRYLR